ncbi:hypothetical protein BpHYR1_014155 [Brachionus plicatilis]|uniref:Uncharacterized protein n=1 Tax=Brachionus plicatilis TaxID=10195 RepID=A0A3M7Q7Z9_BRAPC|nr:hypothetical protein BpHYR1_014155 [Brachionus plicatilis]
MKFSCPILDKNDVILIFSLFSLDSNYINIFEINKNYSTFGLKNLKGFRYNLFLHQITKTIIMK